MSGALGLGIYLLALGFLWLTGDDEYFEMLALAGIAGLSIAAFSGHLL
jgi:hypothetical protein